MPFLHIHNAYGNHPRLKIPALSKDDLSLSYHLYSNSWHTKNDLPTLNKKENQVYQLTELHQKPDSSIAYHYQTNNANNKTHTLRLL